MAFGMNNVTDITLQNITDIGNSSSIAEFFIKVNEIVYGGWYFFFMMLILGIILYMSSQQKHDQPLNNIMYASAVITVLSMLARAIFIVRNGFPVGLLTDYQLWIFPLVTAIVAAIIWSIKD